ncbi:hypothetical protein [Allokutzneria oryzae]|uniref:Uncharacterized protein n=1 Tax=Allokutzneria oryzae TaxID=1378989 RepID=A0ABV5ZTN7_9PSEU
MGVLALLPDLAGKKAQGAWTRSLPSRPRTRTALGPTSVRVYSGPTSRSTMSIVNRPTSRQSTAATVG